MKNLVALVFVVVFATTFTSCKEDVKTERPVPQVKKVLTEAEKKEVNSVVVRIGATPEINNFSRYLLSVGLLDDYKTGAGPYTILAPTNEAFAAMPDDLKKAISNPKNKELLVTILKNHIIDAAMDSVALTQQIKNGTTSLTAASGAALQITSKETNLIVTDAKGTVATIGKSDITASNGVVHVIDKVLLNGAVAPVVEVRESAVVPKSTLEEASEIQSKPAVKKVIKSDPTLAKIPTQKIDAAAEKAKQEAEEKKKAALKKKSDN